MSKQWKSKSLEKYKADNNIVSRNKPSNVNIDFIDEDKSDTSNNSINSNKTRYNNNNNRRNNFGKDEYVQKTDNRKYSSNNNRKKNFNNDNKILVRISNLPKIEQNELTELMTDWGDFNNVSIKEYDNRFEGKTRCAYINFYNKEHAEYFRDAIDGTPFDCLILRVEILDKKIEKKEDNNDKQGKYKFNKKENTNSQIKE